MSTRAQVRFATRETGQSFNQHPEKIHAQFYVHSDGYPEGLGLNIAESILNKQAVDGRSWEIEELQTLHGDLEYIYYVWQKYDDDTWVSIFRVGYGEEICPTCNQGAIGPGEPDKCIFVGTPEKLIEKYKLNTNDDG